MAEPTPLPQTFHVDAPEIAPTPAPGNSPVPDDVHSQLADALGVPAEAVTEGPKPGEAPALAPALSDDVDDAPSSGKSIAEILAARQKTDPDYFTKADPGPAPYPQLVEQAMTPPRPVKDGWWENGDGKLDAPHFTPTGVLGSSNPNAYSDKMQDLFNKVESVTAGESNPVPNPFALRAMLSQKIKRLLDAERGSYDPVEVEGLHLTAQLLAKIMTAGQDDARRLWSELAKHCDDVAAALR